MQDCDKKLLVLPPYCSYFMLSILDHRMFEKIKTYSVYDSMLKQMSNNNLERLAAENNNEAMFMGFLRYVNMQEPESEKKKQGQKLIDRIFKIEKFKALENQSLQILDHESIIFEEGGAPKAHQAN